MARVRSLSSASCSLGLLLVLAQPAVLNALLTSRRVPPLVMNAAASATPLCAALGRGALSTEEQGMLSSLLETRSGVRAFVSAYVIGDDWTYADLEAPAELVAALAAASDLSCDDLVTSMATAAAASVDRESGGESSQALAQRAAGRSALLVRALRPRLAALASSLAELQVAVERKEREFDTARNIWDILLEVRTRAMRLDASIDREGHGDWLRLIERYQYDAAQLAAIRQAIDRCG